MNKRNKSNLISFFVADWCKRIPTKLACGKSLVLGYEEGNAVEINSDGCSDIQDLTCDHEEADSRIFVHCLFAVTRQECGRVVVRSPDTDVAMLCLYNCEELSWKLNFGFTQKLENDKDLFQCTVLFAHWVLMSVSFCQLFTQLPAVILRVHCMDTVKNMLSHY